MIKFFAAILLFSTIACGQTNNKHETESNKQLPISGWETLDHYDYSIQYPSTWNLNPTEQMGLSFILITALETEDDKFRENINLIIQNLSGQNIDLNKYTQISENQIKTMVTNSNLIESKRIKTATSEYHKIIYSGDQGLFHLQFEQYYWVINEKAYVLTFTSEKAKFEKFAPIGEKIMNSFVVKK